MFDVARPGGTGDGDRVHGFGHREESDARASEVDISLAEPVENTETEGEPVAQTYTIEPDTMLSLADRLEPDTTYTVTLDIASGTSKTWELYPYEGIYVEIYSPTTVESTRSEA